MKIIYLAIIVLVLFAGGLIGYFIAPTPAACTEYIEETNALRDTSAEAFARFGDYASASDTYGQLRALDVVIAKANEISAHTDKLDQLAKDC